MAAKQKEKQNEIQNEQLEKPRNKWLVPSVLAIAAFLLSLFAIFYTCFIAVV